MTIRIDRMGTNSVPQPGMPITKSGTTARIEGAANPASYFDGPTVGHLVIPRNEPLIVTGSIRYKDAVQPFRVTLKLRHWEKSRKLIRFCA